MTALPRQRGLGVLRSASAAAQGRWWGPWNSSGGWVALELGRLLALQNKSISVGLFRFKRSLSQHKKFKNDRDDASHLYLGSPQATPALPCTISDFSVQQYSGLLPLVVAAQSTVSLSELGVPQAEWPEVTMIDRPTSIIRR